MVILITGISSGFGLETAQMLAQKGHTVYGTVRREVDKLPGVHYLYADVTDRNAVKSVVEDIVAKEKCIDVLICNAGMGVSGPVEFTSEEDVHRQMDTNFGGVVNFIQATLPYMREAKAGRIICMSSIGGLIGLPFQAFYSASKFALEGFCEGLRLEVRDFGISVTMINPGDFSTGFTGARRKTDASAEKFYPTYAVSMHNIEKDELDGLQPIVVARTISRVIWKKHPAHRYVAATFEQRLSVLLKRILPSRLFAFILGLYYGSSR